MCTHAEWGPSIAAACSASIAQPAEHERVPIGAGKLAVHLDAADEAHHDRRQGDDAAERKDDDRLPLVLAHVEVGHLLADDRSACADGTVPERVVEAAHADEDELDDGRRRREENCTAWSGGDVTA
eukprot:2264384-Prymnesium_polylepis.2